MDTPNLKPIDLTALQPPMNVTLVTPEHGLEELSRFVEKKLNTPASIMGLDTETNWCGDFYFRKVRTIQVGDKEQQFVIDLWTFAESSLERMSETQGMYVAHEIYKPVIDILRPALCSNKVLKVGQNLSFEYMVLLWSFGLRIWHLYSTDLAERVIQAGKISLKKMTEFSMKAIVERHFGFTVNKEEQDTFGADAPLTQKQIDYAAFDVRMPLSMREQQIRIMSKAQLLATAQIENDALGSYQDMHLNGLKLDGPRWMKRIDAVIERRKEELAYLDKEFLKKVGHKNEQIDFEEMAKREKHWREDFELPTELEVKKAEQIRCTRDNEQKKVFRAELEALKKERLAKKKDANFAYHILSKDHTKWKNIVKKCEGEAYINYSSNPKLLETLKKFKGLEKLDSVSDDALLKYNDREMIQVLRRYRKGKKDTGTYGVQWTKQWVTKACKEEGWCHPWDGRIHPVFNQLEAETGRSSSQKPNAQNLPRVKEVRECFICDPPDAEEPEGYNIVTVDMSGAELRIIAELANAKSWIQAFEKGQDVHSVSTEILEPVKWKAGIALPGELDKDGKPIPPCAYYALHDEESLKRNPLGILGEQRKEKCECPKHKKLREHTKAINFLLCYGGGPDALADELGINRDTAIDLMANHERAFPDVWGYLRKSGELAKQKQEARDLYGRRRSFPPPTRDLAREFYIEEHSDRLELDAEDCERNVFNFKAANLRDPNEEEEYSLTHRSPTEGEIQSAMKGLWASIARRGKNHCIQGSNASIIKRAMGCGFDKDGKPYLWHILPQYKAKLLSMIHDELLIQCPKRYAEQVAKAVADAFRRAAAEVMSKVVMEAEWHIAEHWQK